MPPVLRQTFQYKIAGKSSQILENEYLAIFRLVNLSFYLCISDIYCNLSVLILNWVDNLTVIIKYEHQMWKIWKIYHMYVRICTHATLNFSQRSPHYFDSKERLWNELKEKKNEDRYKLIIIANFICRVWSLLHALLPFLGNAYKFNKEKEGKINYWRKRNIKNQNKNAILFLSLSHIHTSIVRRVFFFYLT